MTKYIVLAALASQPALGQVPKAPCNQLVYDQIYATLTQQAIKTQDYSARANAIELLRQLCYDQKFTMELRNIGARTINNTRYGNKRPYHE